MFFQKQQNSNQVAFSIIVFIGFIGILLTTMGCASNIKSAKKSIKQPLIGKVTKVQNSAMLNHKNNLALNDVIALGDFIQTSQDARVELLLKDGTIITLGQNTDLLLNRYIFKPSISKGELFFEIKQGDFAIKTGKLSKQKKKQFSIRTTMALIGVRGTTFWGGSLDGVTFDVALLEGQSVLISNQGGEVWINDIGFGTTLKNFQTAPTKPKKWPQHKIVRALDTVSFK